uniref:J domain-containing protein n=1 Tax=Falco tinnunculus TaxID=100819 RepID=A0A8C4V627_FALTI
MVSLRNFSSPEYNHEIPLVVQRCASADDIKKAYQKLSLKLHPEKKDPENREVAEKKFREVTKAYKVKLTIHTKDIKHLNSEYIVTNFYPDIFKELGLRERNRCIFPILGVSPVPGTGFTSLGSCQAGGCSSSIASLNSSRKANFRWVIAMSKILSGVRIPTERIVTNGKERIETEKDGPMSKTEIGVE